MKKIGLLCLALVLALGTLGAAFAQWTDQLEIGQNPIETGTLTYGFVRYVTCYEQRQNDLGFWEVGEVGDKDVGSCTCELKDSVTDPNTGESGWKTIGCTLDNTYPSYRVCINFYTQNLGTIPFKVTSIDVSDPSSELLYKSGDGGYLGFLFKDNNTNGVWDEGADDRVIDYNFADLKDKEFKPGGSVNISSPYLHVADGAEQGNSYEVSIKIKVKQSV